MTAEAQWDPDTLRDFYGDDGVGQCLLRQNEGQVFDTDGNPVTDIGYYCEHSPVGVHLRDKSLISFTMRTGETDTIPEDTLRRVDMEFVHAAQRDPEHVGTETGSVNNYYKHNTSVEGVMAYAKGVYRSVWDSINVYIYGTSAGPRIAFTVMPGGDPSNILLEFSGQDSIQVDWQGAIRLYVGERWIKLDQALAYQVDANNNVELLTWMGTYEHINGTSLVEFEFYDYDDSLPLIFQIGFPPLPMGGGSALGWSTLLGTTNGIGESEFITAGDADHRGHLHIAGNTKDATFPITPGLLSYVAEYDVYFGAYRYLPNDPDNDATLIWMSYFGGGGNDKPTVLYLSDENNEWGYIAGWTTSEDMFIEPATDPSDGSYYQNQRHGDVDGLYLKYNPGSGQLVRSTYFGGEGDEMFTAITEDVDGNILLAGATTSASGTAGDCSAPQTGFPICSTESNDYQQTSNAGGADAFMVRIDPSFLLGWSTFYGGEGDDFVYDATYQNGGANPLSHRIAIVGSTTDDVPFGTSGSYQQNGTGSTNGFIMTFDADLAPKWGTNIHGVLRLEAVIGKEAGLTVMGMTVESAATSQTCAAVTNTLSICDPGFGAYQDDVVNAGRYDAYFAEFRPLVGTLKWATAHGDNGWNGAIDVDEFTPLYRYSIQQHQPFPIYRFCDLQVDGADNVYGMGFFHHGYPGEVDDQSTVWGWGFYNQAWDSDVGQDQSDLTLFLFDHEFQLEWMSMFGGGFDNVPSPADPYGFDWNWQLKGCEFGQNLVLVPDEVLYWVGTAGGVAFPEACPSPGNSWCESSLTAVGNNLDPMQGFMTRMPLQGISIGMAETAQGPTPGLSCYPNPATDDLVITHNGRVLDGANVQLLDALGRIVREQAVIGGALDIADLSSGAYCARLRVRGSASIGNVRFIVR